jgi:hypothetical protein
LGGRGRVGPVAVAGSSTLVLDHGSSQGGWCGDGQHKARFRPFSEGLRQIAADKDGRLPDQIVDDWSVRRAAEIT